MHWRASEFFASVSIPIARRYTQRINQRAREMFSAGLLEETRMLIDRYGSSVWPLNSLGYKQAMQHLRGELSLGAGDCCGTTGPQKLCQAADDVVSPRAGGPLDYRIWI